MGSEGPKNITFHVTGFKKFQGVTENPTETLVSKLNEYVSKNGLPTGVQLASCTILETAGEGARPALYKLFEKGASNLDNKSIVWVHLGVNSGAQKFAIECQAFNEATFRCSDELGWQPQQVPIVPDDGEISNTRQGCWRGTCYVGTWKPWGRTTCSVDSILSFLKKKGFNVMISDDAGRFVCNYVYYHSLRFAEARGHKSLFVHVPLFSKIDKDTQMCFITSLLGAIAATC